MINPREILSLDSKAYFLFGARWAFGAWLLYVGLGKWLFVGPAGFTGYISKTFAETWAPEPLLLLLTWVILVAEPLCGLWLLSGTKQRLAWTATAKLMFLLMFGQTLIQKFDTVANNWQYFFLALVCAALSERD